MHSISCHSYRPKSDERTCDHCMKGYLKHASTIFKPHKSTLQTSKVRSKQKHMESLDPVILFRDIWGYDDARAFFEDSRTWGAVPGLNHLEDLLGGIICKNMQKHGVQHGLESLQTNIFKHWHLDIGWHKHRANRLNELKAATMQHSWKALCCPLVRLLLTLTLQDPHLDCAFYIISEPW